MAKKERKKDPDEINSRTLLTFRILSKLFNDVGFTGFCVIIMTILVLFFSDKTQKREIIDTWILFKSNNNMTYAIIIIFALVILLIIQQVYYRGQFKLMKDRIDAMAEEKSKLQSFLANRNLSSSNTL